MGSSKGDIGVGIGIDMDIDIYTMALYPEGSIYCPWYGLWSQSPYMASRARGLSTYPMCIPKNS